MRIAGTLDQAGTMKTLECRIASINLASPPQHGRTAASSLPEQDPRQRLPVRRHSLTRPLSPRPVCSATSAVACSSLVGAHLSPSLQKNGNCITFVSYPGALRV
jgi:hypothetical protein